MSDDLTATVAPVATAPTPAPAPAPASPTAPARPDAILIHRHYPRGKAGIDRHLALKNEFAPIFGSKLVYTRHCGLHESFVTGDPKLDHRYWPSAHPNAGQEFYDWTDRGDGVLYGVLTPEAKAYLDEQSQA